MKRAVSLGFPAFMLILIALRSTQPASALKGSGASASSLSYAEIIDSVSMDSVEEHVRFFAGLGTRATGYPGNIQAAEYVASHFEKYLDNVTWDSFTAVDCVDHGANLTYPSGETISIYPMQPNAGAPSTTGPEGVTGPLVYVSDANPEDFQGKQIDGSIVVMNWETDVNWLTAVELGAKAILFITTPTGTLIGGGYGDHREGHQYAWMKTTTKKLVKVPLEMPRFYVAPDETETLLNHLGEKVTVRAHTTWERITTANILGFLEGTEYKDQIVMITSHYDSYSDCPSYAPGAQEATGLAALLELAKFFHDHRPRHSVLFIAYGAEAQGMEGSFRFIHDYILGTDPAKRALGDKIGIQLNLDLDTASDFLLLTRQGSNTQYRSSEHAAWAVYPPLIDHLNLIAEEAAQELGKTYRSFLSSEEDQSGENRYGRPASHYEYGAWYKRRFDTDWMILLTWEAGGANLCIGSYTLTGGVFNKYLWRPFDEIQYVSFDNLLPQLEIIYCLFERTLNAVPSLWEKWSAIPYGNRKGIDIYPTGKPWDYWRSLDGRVGAYSKETAWYTPVPNAVVIVEAEIGTSYNLPEGHGLAHRLRMTDENGFFSFEGAFYTGPNPGWEVEAWLVDPDTGDILMTPDLGMHRYATQSVACDIRDLGYIAVFNSSQITMFNLFTPTTLTPPQDPNTGAWFPPIITVYGEEFTPLESYGYWQYRTPSDSLAVVAFPPGVPATVSVKEVGARYPFLFLTNSTTDNPEGWGFALHPGEQQVISHSTLQYASDMLTLSRERFEALLTVDPAETEGAEYKNYEEAVSKLEEAWSTLESGDYLRSFLYATDAWATGSEIYLYSRTKLEDSSSVVPLFSAFLVPFVLLAERLLFRFSGNRKAVSIIFVFGAIIGALFLLHPGFSMAASPLMNVIGFSSLILVLPIVFIMYSHFTSFLRTVRRKAYGVHEVEVGRTSFMVSAYTMGVENLRRRRLRSSLILLSVILMVVGMAGLTSISAVSITRTAIVPGTPTYQGFYVRKWEWGHGGFQLGDGILNYIQTKYGGNATVAPRLWVYTIYPSNTLYKGLRIGFKVYYQGTNVSINTLLGLTPQETEVTQIDVYLKEGRWFIPTDVTALILTETVADQLGVNVGDQVVFAGTSFTIVGIINNEMTLLKDLDGENLAPIMRNYPGSVNPWNIHMPTEDFIIFPYAFLRIMGGTIPSISVKFDDPSLVPAAARDIATHFPEYNTYFNVEETISLYGRGMQLTVMGMSYQIVPIALVCLSLLNLSLGAIYERRQEISTLSTLGLSPLHTALMFFAETTVYAVVGSITGYVLSLLFLRQAKAYMPFLAPSYGTSGVLLSMGTSMIAVLISSVYPLLIVARQVTPSLKRVWEIPTRPVGDHWEIPLPFHASNDQEAKAMTTFLNEFMFSHEMRGSPVFQAGDIQLKEEATRMQLLTNVRLQPYERGVRQNVTVYFNKPETEDRWSLGVTVRRAGGDISDWEKLNHNFLDAFRKQMLLWRSMKPEDKAKYFES